MPGIDSTRFYNLKAVVNDMVQRQAKFGSLKASVKALDAKYKKVDCGDFAYYEDKKTGKLVAEARIYDNKDGEIYDLSNKTGINYITNAYETNSDKFIYMEGRDEMSHAYYTIEDSNRNGIVDGDDKIKISSAFVNEGNAFIKTIADFLGL